MVSMTPDGCGKHVGRVVRPDDLSARFRDMVRKLDTRFRGKLHCFDDDRRAAAVVNWLEDGDKLRREGRNLTPDQWFLITTLYGRLNLNAQRSLIRDHLDRFRASVKSDLRRLSADSLLWWQLALWMIVRIGRMADHLRMSNQTMSQYTADLRRF